MKLPGGDGDDAVTIARSSPGTWPTQRLRAPGLWFQTGRGQRGRREPLPQAPRVSQRARGGLVSLLVPSAVAACHQCSQNEMRP